MADVSFELPESHIAVHPPEERGGSKLLAVDVKGDLPPINLLFKDIVDLLPADSHLLFNDSRGKQHLCASLPGGHKFQHDRRL